MKRDNRRRKRRRLIEGLLGPGFYQKKKLTKLQILRRQIIVGGILWIIATPLLSILFDHAPLSIIADVFTFGGWLILMLLNLRYFYLFAFKKDEAEASDDKNK
jgi:hypothetical protein